METGLKGKVVIVTGGASTIGRSIVLAFAKEGSKVVIADIDEPQGQKTASKAIELGAEGALVIKTDVTKADEVENMVKAVINRFGQIDVLVNDVGGPSDKLLAEENKESLDAAVALNFYSAVNCTKAVLPHMIERKKGSIVNLGSEAGRTGHAERVIYSACKGGVISFTKAMARDVGRHGITVNCVCPHTIMPAGKDEVGEGSVFHPKKGMFGDASRGVAKYQDQLRTALMNHSIVRMGKPSDIAPAVVFLASEGAGYITGQSISVNGGATMI